MVSGDVRTVAPPEPPKPVRLARAVWIGGAALGALRSLVQLADRHALVEQLRASAPELTQDQLNSMASTGIGVGLLLLAGFVAVNVWLAARMVAGVHWARMVITTFAVAELVFGTIGLIGIAGGAGAALPVATVTPVQIGFSAVGVVVDAVLLVLLRRKESVEYFRAMRARRLAPPSAPPAPPSGFL